MIKVTLVQHPLGKFWGKSAEGTYHPLVFHCLDVAACSDALLAANPNRLEFLAALCEMEPEALRRLLVYLIALHDIGKCSRGFQGKVLELWPSALGPRPEPEHFISVRHDAAGLWLFLNEPHLAAIGARLMPDLLISERMQIFQSVFGHHGEPLETNFRGGVTAIAYEEAQIGRAAQLAAVEMAGAFHEVFNPSAVSPSPEHIPVLSFALAGLTTLADWLGSNRQWFNFTAWGGENLTGALTQYWRDIARPIAARAVREAGLISVDPSPFTGIKSLFPHIDQPTPLQRLCEECALCADWIARSNKQAFLAQLGAGTIDQIQQGLARSGTLTRPSSRATRRRNAIKQSSSPRVLRRLRKRRELRTAFSPPAARATFRRGSCSRTWARTQATSAVRGKY